MDVLCHITRAGADFVRRLMIEVAQIAMRDSARYRRRVIQKKGHTLHNKV